MYNREMQVLAVGRCESSAGRMVTLGIGWKPSSEAGKAGDPVQKYTNSCLSKLLIFSTIDQSHFLKRKSLSLASPLSSLNEVYDIKVVTLMSPTPFNSNLKSSAVSPITYIYQTLVFIPFG